jgi:hypothetical protein
MGFIELLDFVTPLILEFFAHFVGLAKDSVACGVTGTPSPLALGLSNS